jgi:hypothetical protein
MTRRDLLRGVLALAATASAPGRAGAALEEGLVGCMLHTTPGSRLAQQIRIVASSGEEDVDRVCWQIAGALRQAFRVSPDFGFFDDDIKGPVVTFSSASGNAIATPERLIGNGQGTVLLGRSLAGVTSARRKSGFRGWGPDRTWPLGLRIIIGHEWAHILQFARGNVKQGKGAELHADFLAGWFLGYATRRQGGPVVDPKDAMSAIFGRGDNLAFNDPQHHGRPVQRAGAIAEGLEAGATVNDVALAYAKWPI